MRTLFWQEVTVETAEVMAWARAYCGPKFHALVSDPPYELGFMGKTWDKSGIAFQAETWALLTQHLLPGAFGMVFASSRGWHRLACAIEDAGLLIHPSIFGWLNAMGFPKATRIDTQVDQAAGITVKRGKAFNTAGGGDRIHEFHVNGRTRVSHQPVEATAQTWAGHRYGLQALKPALEPIIVFQKPYAGRPVDSITTHGAGALWIDGARVAHGNADLRRQQGTHRHTAAPVAPNNGWKSREDVNNGRWPANVVL